MSLSAKKRLSCPRAASSCTSRSAVAADRRSETPNDCSGATRALTCGRYVVTLVHKSSHVSAGWTSVEYVRSPRPSPRSTRCSSEDGPARSSNRFHLPGRSGPNNCLGDGGAVDHLLDRYREVRAPVGG